MDSLHKILAPIALMEHMQMKEQWYVSLAIVLALIAKDQNPQIARVAKQNFFSEVTA